MSAQAFSSRVCDFSLSMWRFLWLAALLTGTTNGGVPQYREITFPPVEQYKECYVDEQHSVQGTCKNLLDCPMAADRWHYRNIRPQTCYFEKFDHYVCCEKEQGNSLVDIGRKEKAYHTFKPRRCEVACAQNYLSNGESIAEPKDYPFMVALGWKMHNGDGMAYQCSGILISPTFILTAAHCVERRMESSVVVRTGGRNLNDYLAKDLSIKHIFVHPDFNATAIYNDIALVELNEAAIDTRACVWSQPDLSTNQVDVIGYGHAKVDGITPNHLLKGKKQIIPNEECNRFFQKDLPDGVVSTQICAKDMQQRSDICQGDSGSPIVLQSTGPDSRTRTHVVGITSFGLGCENDKPSVYTRVTSYLDWIEGIVWPEST